MTPSHSLSHTLWRMLHRENDPLFKRFGVILSGLILLSCLILALTLALPPTSPFQDTLLIADQILLGFFLLEYLARLWTVPPRIPHTVRLPLHTQLFYHLNARARFALQPMSLLDLAAIIALVPTLRSLRILRLLRLLRALQFFRYYNPFATLNKALRGNGLLFLFTFSFFGVAVVMGGLSLYLTEHPTNPNVTSLPDTFYWAVVTITTVGYGDITPQTPSGRLVAMTLMVSGMGLLALIAGVISQTLVSHILPLRAEQVRMSMVTDHIVICGWNPRVTLLIQQLHDEYREFLPDIIVFAPLDARPTGLDEAIPFVPGFPTKELELDKVRLAFARTVIIVGHQNDQSAPPPSTIDAQTVLTLFTVRSFERKLHSRNVQRTTPLHLCCEIHDPENLEHARIAGANEIILTSSLSAGLLSHASAFPGASQIFSELLHPIRQTLYVEALATSFRSDALTFGDLATQMRVEADALLIGYQSDDEIIINPPHDRILPADVRIVYLATRPLSRRRHR